MKPSFQKQAVIDVTKQLVELFFKSDESIVWDDISKLKSSIYYMLKYQPYLDKHKRVIAKGATDGMHSLTLYNNSMLVKYSIINYDDLWHRLDAFIRVIVMINPKRDLFAVMVWLLKRLNFISDDCKAVEIEWLDV